MNTVNGWVMLVIPAIATEDAAYQIGPGERDAYHRRAGEVLLPDREPREVLDATRVGIGSMNFAAQYQQDPVPPGGNVIQNAWLRSYESEPEKFHMIVSSWDLASTLGEDSSYSVGQLWGVSDGKFYLLDVVRDRLEAPALRHRMIETVRDWEADANLVEATELGRTLVQDIRRTTDVPLLPVRPKGDKVARLLAQSARFEAGQIYLPEHAPWLAAYMSELLAFPYGRYDDQVDATSQALNYLTAKLARTRDRPRRDLNRRDNIRVDFIGKRNEGGS